MTERNAGLWEDLENKGSKSVAAPIQAQPQNGNEEDLSPVRPFENNNTPELLGLYRALMKLSRMGPLTSQPARLLVKLIQELIQRGEKI